MKIKLFIIIFSLLSAIYIAPVKAQQNLSDKPVSVMSSDVSKVGSQLLINITLDLTNLKLQPNRSMSIVPVLYTKDNNKVLSKILVNGRTKHIVYTRNTQRKKYKDVAIEVKRIDNVFQHVNYQISVPFQKWMQQAILSLRLDLCGCGGNSEENAQLKVLALADLNIKENDENNFIPAVAYLVPQNEAIKKRTEKGSAYLDFPVNETIIYPDYRRNPDELKKIKQTIEIVKNDKNTNITSITIHGYASPEGSYPNNERLAKERADALKLYVRNLYNFDKNIITTTYTPEDWEGLSRFVTSSGIKTKKEIQAIIDQNIHPDMKEQKLKKLEGGELFRYLQIECFPALRHSDYMVNYVVRGFSIEETKDVIGKRPQQLSLKEMFMLAQTYVKGSSEFNEVFEIAVRMFPEDPIANLNASSIALIKHDLSSAKKYLQKADNELPETINNLGILAMFEGRKEEAQSLFDKALKAGIPEAATNLKELNKEKE